VALTVIIIAIALAVGRSMHIRSLLARVAVTMALGGVFALGVEVAGPASVSAQKAVSARGSASDDDQGLACIQRALGGSPAFARVSSLRIVGETKPVVSGPLPGTREIRVVFPDKYERIDVGRPPKFPDTTLSSTIGFNDRLILSEPRAPDRERAMRSARLDFARQMWMRLPRSIAGVQISSRAVREGNRQRLALDLIGPDGFRATLLADAASCVPVALEYPTNTTPHSTTTRVDLADYRDFGGIRFPTVLTTSDGGRPWVIERVSQVELNAANSRQYFAPGH
jgi:hypothetical protein